MPETNADHDQLPELPDIQNGPDFVIMQHQVTGGIAEAHKTAFTELWQGKGWRVVKVWSDPSLVDVTDQPTEPPVPIHDEVEIPEDDAVLEASPPDLHPGVNDG